MVKQAGVRVKGPSGAKAAHTVSGCLEIESGCQLSLDSWQVHEEGEDACRMPAREESAKDTHPQVPEGPLPAHRVIPQATPTPPPGLQRA